MVYTASALQGMYIGSGTENIRNIFKGAKLLNEKSGKGVILFIDELDSLGNREHRSGGAGEHDYAYYYFREHNDQASFHLKMALTVNTSFYVLYLEC